MGYLQWMVSTHNKNPNKPLGVIDESEVFGFYSYLQLNLGYCNGTLYSLPYEQAMERPRSVG